MKMLNGEQALLLAEGCKIRKEGKLIDARLKKIREELNITNPDTYCNAAGDELVVAETVKFSEIEPKKVLDYLKKQRMVGRFPETVKVQITALKKVVPEAILQKWRVPLDSVLRLTWK